MGISVDDYSANNLSGKVYSKYSTTEVNTNMSESDTTSYMDFDSYLKLLTAQMSNQDFNNSMSDSEFIQQMASYSMMEAISQMTKQTSLSYTSSLIGKAVTVSDGSAYPDTGIVEAVTVTNEGCKILVNGNQYSADSITDVVDGNVFLQLNSFVGHTVELKDGDGTITGKVTGVVIKNGDGYIAVDNKALYNMSAIVRIIDAEEGTESEGGESTEGTEGTENNGGESGGAADVEESAAAYLRNDEVEGVTARSEAAYDTLMKMLDNRGESATASVAEQYARASVQSRLSSMNYVSATVDGAEASSGLVADRIPAPAVSRDYIPEVTASTARTVSSNASASANYDRGGSNGVINVSDMAAESSSLEQYSEEVYYDDIPYSSRKYAEDYPLEAAFADEVGTNMIDIRFIGNTEINSVIDTSEIICYSEKGRAVTDIGWCGKGMLGEVITFADGTQRVEIIGPTEVSYLYTSGNLTLDQICDPNAAPGSLAGKLTPFEVAIRHYATEYTAEEKAEMKAFEEYCRWHARANNLG